MDGATRARRNTILIGLAGLTLSVLALGSFATRSAPKTRSPEVVLDPPAASLAHDVRRAPSAAPPAAPESGIYGHVLQGAGVARDAHVCAICSLPDCGGPRAICVRADRYGHYALARLPAGRYWVSASARGFAPELARAGERGLLSLARNQRIEGVDIALRERGETVEGRVVDAWSKPIVGAEVRVASQTAAGAVAMAHSDGEGRFALHAAAGMALLRVSARGYAPLQHSAQAPIADLTLVLEASGSMSGRVVTADDAPVEGVTIITAPDAALLLSGVDDRALSGRDGDFALDGLAPGTYTLVARSPGCFGHLADIVVRAGEATAGLVVQVANAVRIEGRVLMARDQAPCEAGIVSIGPTDARAPLSAIAAIEADGRIRFEGIAPGRYAVSVECVGQPEQHAYPTLEVGSTTLSGLVWEVRSGTRIVGRVVDSRGRALPAREVIAQALDLDAPGYASGQAISGPDGEFALDLLDEGKYRLSVLPDLDRGFELTLATGSPPAPVTLISEAQVPARRAAAGAP